MHSTTNWLQHPSVDPAPEINTRNELLWEVPRWNTPSQLCKMPNATPGGMRVHHVEAGLCSRNHDTEDRIGGVALSILIGEWSRSLKKEVVEDLNTHELRSIRDKLASFDARCEVIMTLLGDKRHLLREDRSHVEELYRSLKDDLKRAATVGTVRGEKRALTDAEEGLYAPAVRAAALALAPAVNSNPIASNWFSALYDAQIEFAHYMPKLEGA